MWVKIVGEKRATCSKNSVLEGLRRVLGTIHTRPIWMSNTWGLEPSSNWSVGTWDWNVSGVQVSGIKDPPSQPRVKLRIIDPPCGMLKRNDQPDKAKWGQTSNPTDSMFFLWRTSSYLPICLVVWKTLVFSNVFPPGFPRPCWPPPPEAVGISPLPNAAAATSNPPGPSPPLGRWEVPFHQWSLFKKTLKLFEFNLFTLWLCQNSYWKWPFISWVFPLKMVIFNSYVSLPEGNLFNYHVNRLNMVKPAPANAPTGLRSSLLGSHIGLVSHLRILMEEAGHQTRRKPMSNWQWSLEKTQAGWDWADMISRISMYKYHYDWHY